MGPYRFCSFVVVTAKGLYNLAHKLQQDTWFVEFSSWRCNYCWFLGLELEQSSNIMYQCYLVLFNPIIVFVTNLKWPLFFYVISFCFNFSFLFSNYVMCFCNFYIYILFFIFLLLKHIYSRYLPFIILYFLLVFIFRFSFFILSLVYLSCDFCHFF